MRSVGIKVLKNKLSEYVRIAASGETVWSPIAIAWWRNSCRRSRGTEVMSPMRDGLRRSARDM